MAEVRLKEVRKVFDKEVVAVDGANIEIADKEFVVLVGPSGCGKSTTLRMIAGLEEITSGEIYIDGQLVNDVPPKDRDIAMVFQNYALYPHMTVYQNMAFGLKLRKYPKEEIDARVREAAEILGIEDLLERKPKALSGGQRQRVAVGRAIVRKPKVFLFDEPLSNLAAKLRVQMRAEISKLHSSLEATMIYVTHDQVEAMTLASRIVLLTPGGRIGQVGKPLELYTRPQNEFVAQFIGSPAMNLIPGEVVGTGEQTSIKLENGGVAVSAATTRSSEEGLKVNVGVRPEDLVETDGDCIFEGKVSITEELGEVTLLHFDRVQDKDAMVAKLPGIHTGLRGNSVKLTAEPPKIHVFYEGVSLYHR